MLIVGTDLTPHDWGGRACLALVNSVLWRRSDAPVEVLTDYGRLVDLIGEAGWLPAPARLQEAAAGAPAAAAAALDRTLTLREALFRLLSAVAAGEDPEAADRSVLNDALAAAAPQLLLGPDLRPCWTDPVALDLPRWQAAMSAAQVLTADDRTRLKQCPGERCGWLFMDSSRNRSRRWCEPNECGNRERVRNYYRRSRAG